jgi:hypothetical protein
MTLSELALLVGATPKWLLNAAAVVPMPKRYTLDLARRLVVARALQDATGVQLPRAYRAAADVLSRYGGNDAAVTLAPNDSGAVRVQVDVHRLLSETNVRLSQLNTMHAPGRRGPRRAVRRDAIRAAAEYGLDISLLRANLARTPAQRLAQLDGMVAFRQGVKRGPLA